MSKLKPYFFQKDAVRFIESSRPPIQSGYGIIGDDCGLGKTIDAALISYLHLDEGSFLIVCTASMKLKWAREIKKWTGKDSYIIYGEKEHHLPKSKYYIINYHILGRENKLDRKKENRRRENFKTDEEKRQRLCKVNGEQFKKKRYRKGKSKLEGWITELAKKNIIGIFPDECHRLANDETCAWTKCFIKLVNDLNPKILVPLSGTLTRKRTKSLFPILNLVAPKLFPSKYRFYWRYCDPTRGYAGWEYNGSSNEDELNKKLKTVMIRRLKKDIPGFPKKIYSVIPMELTSKELKNYSGLSFEFKDLLKGNGLKSKHIRSKLILLAYLAKRNSIFNWIDDYLEDHEKLVLGAWNKKVIDDVMNKYGNSILKIDGSIPSKKRLAIEDRFQTDASIKIIILQIEAGGEGLTLTASEDLAIIQCPDTPGQIIQVADRIHRIGQKSDSVTIYYLYAPGTIEDKIADEIENSYKSIEAILDGKKSDGLFKYSFKNL